MLAAFSPCRFPVSGARSDYSANCTINMHAIRRALAMMRGIRELLYPVKSKKKRPGILPIV
jgi:hypothetical protein